MITRRSYNTLLDKQFALSSRIKQCEKINEELKVLKKQYAEGQDLLNKIMVLKEKFHDYYELCKKEESAYKERRKLFMETYITEYLAEIFPEQQFIAKIVEKNIYNYNRVSLVIMDEYGNERDPLLSEGKFCQQLISTAAVVAAVHNSNKHALYIDEAFSASSPSNLVKASNILERIQQEGIFCLLISQHAELYRDVHRREIHLDYDYLKNVTIIKNTTDFSGGVSSVD